MPSLSNLMNLALGYGTRAEERSGPRFLHPTATFAYGSHKLQALDFHSAGAGTRPLLAFVHGGAWQFGDKARRRADAKAAFAHGEGWHFASLNFRMVPEVGVAEMAHDVAAAAALLITRAGEMGVDPARIVLMGHSSGAHLAALAASNPALLAAHGLEPSMLAGVIANDGAAFDACEPSTGSRWLARRLIDPAFAAADCDALSPVRHLKQNSTTCPPFLILHTSDHHSRNQALLLAEAVWCNRGDAMREQFPGRGPLAHMRLSRRFGQRGHAPTEAARMWLRKVFR